MWVCVYVKQHNNKKRKRRARQQKSRKTPTYRPTHARKQWLSARKERRKKRHKKQRKRQEGVPHPQSAALSLFLFFLGFQYRCMYVKIDVMKCYTPRLSCSDLAPQGSQPSLLPVRPSLRPHHTRTPSIHGERCQCTKRACRPRIGLLRGLGLVVLV